MSAKNIDSIARTIIAQSSLPPKCLKIGPQNTYSLMTGVSTDVKNMTIEDCGLIQMLISRRRSLRRLSSPLRRRRS